MGEAGRQSRRCTVMVLFLFCLSRKDLVRVEATVIEKTESWPKINMKFRKRKNFRKKKSKCETVYWTPVLPAHSGCAHVLCQVAGQCQGNVIVPALCGIRSAPGLSHCPIVTCRPQSSCNASMAATLLGYSSGISSVVIVLENWKQLPHVLGMLTLHRSG